MNGEAPSTRTVLDLLGHQAAEQDFLEAWVSGRVPHAWLIAGPKGIGKATLAYRIARFVLAGGGAGGLFGPPASLDVEADHPAARRIASGGHADLKVLERRVDEKTGRLRTEIAIDDVRGVGDFLSLTPAEGGWRIVIADSADEMSRSSANAILKVLEEPPRNALMLLVSHNPGRLLPTIRSRCRRLSLHPLAEECVETLLARHAPDFPAAERAVVVAMAEGSIGRALALSQEGGGLDLYREMQELMAALPALDLARLHAFAERAAANETAFRAITDLLGWWMARAATDFARGEGGDGRRLVGLAGLDRWVKVWEKILYTFGRADAVNLDRKLVMLNAFLALERACHP